MSKKCQGTFRGTKKSLTWKMSSQRVKDCAEVVAKKDVRMRTNLVKCCGNQVHKYCQKDCLEPHKGVL